MPLIIISSRATTVSIAKRIRQALSRRFGSRAVAMAPAGAQAAPSHADLVVFVVGPDWTGDEAIGLRAADDPVRRTLEAALRSGTPVLPVLVDGALMPAPSELPDDLQDFAFRNGAVLPDGSGFQSRIRQIVGSIEDVLQAPAPPISPADRLRAGFDSLLASLRNTVLPILRTRTGIALGVVVIAAALAALVLLPGGPGPAVDSPAETNTRPVTTVPIAGAPLAGCDPAAPIPSMDDARVPQGTVALQEAMAQPLVMTFRCNPASMERQAALFAAVAALLPLHVSDAACFKDATPPVTADWAALRSWAAGQSDREVLATRLADLLRRAVSCLKPDAQQKLYVEVARTFTAATERDGVVTFTNPTLRGQRIDRCLYKGRDCNEPAAFAWCNRFGYRRLGAWEWAYADPTVTLGDGLACGGKGCAAFSTVTCVR